MVFDTSFPEHHSYYRLNGGNRPQKLKERAPINVKKDVTLYLLAKGKKGEMLNFFLAL